MKEFCKEYPCSTTVDTTQSVFPYMYQQFKNKELLLFVGYLIIHLFTKNILQQNSAKCQINVYKAWRTLKKNPVPIFPLNQK